MKLSVKGTAMSCGLIWGGCMLTVGIINLAKRSYGKRFLRMMSSMYPRFHASRTVPDVLVGAGYGFTDGAVAGALYAMLYNRLAGPSAGRRGNVGAPVRSSLQPTA